MNHPEVLLFSSGWDASALKGFCQQFQQFILLEFIYSINLISKIQLVVYYQCCILIAWATTRLYVIAH